jgi:hypothetical protein
MVRIDTRLAVNKNVGLVEVPATRADHESGSLVLELVLALSHLHADRPTDGIAATSPSHAPQTVSKWDQGTNGLQ